VLLENGIAWRNLGVVFHKFWSMAHLRHKDGISLFVHGENRPSTAAAAAAAASKEERIIVIIHFCCRSKLSKTEECSVLSSPLEPATSADGTIYGIVHVQHSH
jgi:hypothetical protein